MSPHGQNEQFVYSRVEVFELRRRLHLSGVGCCRSMVIASAAIVHQQLLGFGSLKPSTSNTTQTFPMPTVAEFKSPPHSAYEDRERHNPPLSTPCLGIYRAHNLHISQRTLF
jgi:hypothetical protein